MPLAVHVSPPPCDCKTASELGMDLHDVARDTKSRDVALMSENGDEDSSQFSLSPREEHSEESDMCLRMFENWGQVQQTEFVEQLILRMSFHQHEHIYSILMPMLQRDFITALPGERTLTHTHSHTHAHTHTLTLTHTSMNMFICCIQLPSHTYNLEDTCPCTCAFGDCHRYRRRFFHSWRYR